MAEIRHVALRIGMFIALAGCTSPERGANSVTYTNSVVSTSLCGDAYILALVPDRAAALSWQSRSDISTADPTMRVLPQTNIDPEQLANWQDATILIGPGEQAKGANIVKLDWGEDYETVWKNMSRLELALDQNATVQLDLRARLAALPELTNPPRILYLNRAGGTAGPGTFVDAVITAAGAKNAVTEPGWQSPDTEQLMLIEADILLTSFFGSQYVGASDSAIRHKALADRIADLPNIDIPGALWPCAGPGLIDAAERLSAELQTF